jgi:hypothetical protein
MAKHRSISPGNYILLFSYHALYSRLTTVLLVIGRVVNVLIPRQLGIVTDELTGENNQPRTSPLPAHH